MISHYHIKVFKQFFHIESCSRTLIQKKKFAPRDETNSSLLFKPVQNERAYFTRVIKQKLHIYFKYTLKIFN